MRRCRFISDYWPVWKREIIVSFTINLAKARGTCAGVNRAIATVTKALELFGKDKVWVLHEVVHNKHVVENLRKIGAHFIETLDEAPDGCVLIFSAHGVSVEIQNEAQARGFHIIDATCPVVQGIHTKINRAADYGIDAVVIGHKGHQEVLGTVGQYTGDKSKVHVIISEADVEAVDIDGNNACFATQTTLSTDETAKTVKALRAKYPNIQGPRDADTCKATQVRQNAIRELAKISDVVLIAGSVNSSNSNRLREVAESQGTRAYLVDDSSGIDLSWLEGVSSVGLSAGASAPEYIVEEIIEFLNKNGATALQEVGSDLNERTFPLPRKGLP